MPLAKRTANFVSALLPNLLIILPIRNPLTDIILGNWGLVSFITFDMLAKSFDILVFCLVVRNN